jgi:hypothetical protein
LEQKPTSEKEEEPNLRHSREADRFPRPILYGKRKIVEKNEDEALF